MIRALITLLLLAAVLPVEASAIPALARQYEMSCSSCHAAVPRLNSFGNQVSGNYLRAPGWEAKTPLDVGDDDVAVPKVFPVAARIQAFVAANQAFAKSEDPQQALAEPMVDFKAPYMVKLMSGAPVTPTLSYYFYAILAEKGENGSVVLEDAWLAWNDPKTGLSLQVGQFQVSDLMFPREVRLTFQDYQVYRMTGITYDRGLIAGWGTGPVSVNVGAVNGNGIKDSFVIDSPGYNRPDHLFDNDSMKSVFARVGTGIGPATVGVFGLVGERDSVDGERTVPARMAGLDLSANLNNKVFLYGQGLYVRWDGVVEEDARAAWYGGFVGVDWVPRWRWAFSGLVNFADAGDLRDSGTVLEGLDTQLLTGTVSYYPVRNARFVFEVNGDLQPADALDGVGHDSREGAVLVGVDLAL